MERPKEKDNDILMNFENRNYFCSLKSLTYIILEYNLGNSSLIYGILEEVFVSLVIETLSRGGVGYYLIYYYLFK